MKARPCANYPLAYRPREGHDAPRTAVHDRRPSPFHAIHSNSMRSPPLFAALLLASQLQAQETTELPATQPAEPVFAEPVTDTVATGANLPRLIEPVFIPAPAPAPVPVIKPYTPDPADLLEAKTIEQGGRRITYQRITPLPVPLRRNQPPRRPPQNVPLSPPAWPRCAPVARARSTFFWVAPSISPTTARPAPFAANGPPAAASQSPSGPTSTCATSRVWAVSSAPTAPIISS